MTEEEARAAVVDAYRALARLGMNTGSTGNVSIRFAPGMIITPTGASAEELSAGRLVAMKLDGRAQANRQPSSEWEMHAGIYAGCPEANFIIHTHADACTALSCLNESLPAFHYMIA
jgi:L-fuculose-phosphate aldolase